MRVADYPIREEVANGSHTIDYSAEVTHVVALTVTHELDHELDHVNHRHARSGEVHKMTEGARDEFFLRHSFVETLTMCVNDVPGPAT